MKRKAVSSDFSDPEVDKLWCIYERYGLVPEDLISVLNKKINEISRIYIKFGGEGGNKHE